MKEQYTIERLDWDSEFFGYKVGKITINDSLSFDNSSFIDAAKNYKLVYVMSENEIFDAPFKFVDKKITFSQTIGNRELIQRDFDFIRSFNPLTDSLSELVHLAYESGEYSRLNIDSNFSNNEFKRLYKEWLIKSVNNSIDYDVYVYIGDSNKIIGFISLAVQRKGVSEIVLIAVAGSERGKGIARKLVNKAINQTKLNNFKKIEVVTQGINTPALSLYTNTGFKTTTTIYIYHYWTP